MRITSSNDVPSELYYDKLAKKVIEKATLEVSSRYDGIPKESIEWVRIKGVTPNNEGFGRRFMIRQDDYDIINYANAIVDGYNLCISDMAKFRESAYVQNGTRLGLSVQKLTDKIIRDRAMEVINGKR